MKDVFLFVNRAGRVPALAVAILLQVLPLVRTAAVLYENLAPAFAIILRLSAYTAAAMGGVNAVSGATQIDQPPPPYQMKLTNGVAFFQPLHVSGQTANYWTISSKPAWMNINGVNGSPVWSLSGVPTVTGVTTHTLTAKENQQTTDPERSMSVTLTVTVVDPGSSTPPTIRTPPAGATVNAGTSASLFVEAFGTDPLTYQWRRDGTMVGGDSATLSFNPVTAGDAGSYDVIVSNAAGSVTSAPPAVLTVVVPPVIEEPPSSQIGYLGGTIRFVATALSTVPVTYQWFRDGTPVGTGSELILHPLAATDAGGYEVTVSNQAGSVTSSSGATLAVVAPPSVHLQLDPVQPATGPRTIQWQGLAQKSYMLQRRDNFSPDIWQDLGETTVTSDGPAEMIDTTADGTATRFYRIRTE